MLWPMKVLTSRWTRGIRSRIFVDWAPPIVLMLFTQYSIWVYPTTSEIPGPKPAAGALYALTALALAYRRKVPVLALGASLGICAWELFRGAAPETESFQQQGSLEAFLSVCLAAYAMGAYSGGRLSVASGLLLPALVPIADSFYRDVAIGTREFFSEILPFWIWTAVICVIGRGARNRQIMVSLLGERADRLERDREEKARAAVAEERARIARELHDVVAHGVSVMVVQAGAARRVMKADPGQAETSLLAVEATGRQSLAEMRRLLGVLRTDPQALDLAPQPGLGQVDDLLEKIREAGLSVELRSEGVTRPLPAGADLVAFRVIQEGLTNVMKHAGHATATVTIGYHDNRVDLEVRDDGQGVKSHSDGRGHGLFGMRERVSLYGGSVEAGPGRTGGFVVTASIPTVAGP